MKIIGDTGWTLSQGSRAGCTIRDYERFMEFDDLSLEEFQAFLKELHRTQPGCFSIKVKYLGGNRYAFYTTHDSSD